LSTQEAEREVEAERAAKRLKDELRHAKRVVEQARETLEAVASNAPRRDLRQ
jgi:hypothetical protein